MGISFLYYWPTLLALVSRAAPAKVNATLMGLAFMSLFISNNLIGWIGGFYEKMTPAAVLGNARGHRRRRRPSGRALRSSPQSGAPPGAKCGVGIVKIDNFFSELKRRNVYKVAVAYAVVGWLLVQVATQVFPFFEIPDWAVRLVVDCTRDWVSQSRCSSPGRSNSRLKELKRTEDVGC